VFNEFLYILQVLMTTLGRGPADVLETEGDISILLIWSVTNVVAKY
jgi:hypothetical protein